MLGSFFVQITLTEWYTGDREYTLHNCSPGESSSGLHNTFGDENTHSDMGYDEREANNNAHLTKPSYG